MIRLFLFLTLSIMTSLSTANAQQDTRTEAVLVAGDTLLYIYGGTSSIDIRERASVISKRFEDLLNDPAFNPQEIAIQSDSLRTSLVYKEQLLITITEADVKANEQASAAALAVVWQNRVRDMLEMIQDERSIYTLTKEIALVGGVIVLLLLLIYFINKLFRWVRYRIIMFGDQKLKSFHFRGYHFVSGKQFIRYILTVFNIVRIFLVVLLVYLSLPLIFSVFPWSENIANQLIGYILSPVKKILTSVIHYIPNLLTIIVIFTITRYLVRIVKFLAQEVEKGSLKIEKFYPDWAMPTYNIVRSLLYIFMFIVIFPYLPGSESKVFQGVSVFLGVLISFGSSSAISNIVAGVVLTYMRPYKLGDRVKVGEILGNVTEKNLLVTRIRTIKNEDITVPNSSILAGHTINYTDASQQERLLIYTTVSLGYEIPWQKVHELLISAANKTKGVVDKEHFVLQKSLDDFYVSYEINAYVSDEIDFVFIYSELHQQIQDAFNEAGIEIMSPHYRAIRDGNNTTMPEQYIPKDFETPGFRIHNPKHDLK